MIKYKINVLEALKEEGYTTYKLKKDKLLPDTTIHRLRHDQPISMESLDTVCRLLDMQPGNIIKYRPDDDEE